MQRNCSKSRLPSVRSKASCPNEGRTRPNPASAFAPAPVKVTFHDYHNVYAYSPAELWLAYGLALSLAAFAAALGLITLVANGASFGDDFSAVLLVGRGATFSVEPKDEDMTGRHPMPPRLAKAKVSVSSSQHGNLVERKSRSSRDVTEEGIGSGDSASLPSGQAGKARTI